MTSHFIASHGEDIAERYVMHQCVEARRAARNYEACHERLGYEPMTSDELSDVEAAYRQVIDRFGEAFATRYGWAAHHLESRRPTFSEIERAVDIDHLRAHYQMASHSVHANPRGVFFQLGLLDETGLLLAGPSSAGFADPGHAAAISLVQVSAALAPLNPTLDNIVALMIMLQLEQEIGEAFAEATKRMERDAS